MITSYSLFAIIFHDQNLGPKVPFVRTVCGVPLQSTLFWKPPFQPPHHCGDVTLFGNCSAKKMSKIQMIVPLSRAAEVMKLYSVHQPG